MWIVWRLCWLKGNDLDPKGLQTFRVWVVGKKKSDRAVALRRGLMRGEFCLSLLLADNMIAISRPEHGWQGYN